MKIAILAVTSPQMLDIVGPMDVFAEANYIIPPKKRYEVSVIAMNKTKMVASNGLHFTPHASVNDDLGNFDTILVSGNPDLAGTEQSKQLLAWIRKHAPKARRVGSICLGAFLLGHAGLLDGRRATTHWCECTRLAETFPKIKVEANRIFVKDGSIYTSAGVTAAMDLALAMVEEDFGKKIALRVAKELVLFLKRPGGQSQFSFALAAQLSDSEPIRDIQEWILANLAKDLSVSALSKRMNMSPRNFARLFKREVGVTPGDYVETARIESAQRILEESSTHLKKVADLCGFSDPNGLRRAFVRHLKVTPIEYRERFQHV